MMNNTWAIIEAFANKDTDVLGYYQTEQLANEAVSQLNKQNPRSFYEVVSVAE